MKSARPCKVLASAAGARVQPVQRRFASQFALSEAGAFKVATSEEGSGPTSAITVALKAGPRFETAPGAASCLKNFVFRATNKRSALRIIREAEIYGGVLSTSLSREHLFLTAEFLSGDEAYFAEILGDVVSQSRLLPHEFVEEVAPSTLAEYEYAMHSPQALALDKLHTLAFRTGLGNSLYATPEVSMDHSKAASFAQAAFSSPVNVAVLANNVSSSVLKSLVGEHFAAGNASISAGALTSSATKYHGGEARVPLAGDKAFLAIAFKAATSPQYAVLKELLGGEPSVKWSKGISGLASAAPGAKAFYSAYSDAALIGFTISASNARAGDIAVKAVAELKRIAKGGLKQEEVKQAIAKAKFAAASALDSRVGKLELVGAELLSTGKLSSMDDAFAALDKVTGDAVAKAASEALKSKMSYVAVGNPSLPYADSLGV